MNTTPDPKFPDLPGLIFGCTPSKHRKDHVKMILGRYNVQVRGNDRKEDHLQKLIELENSIGEREKEALVKWFTGDNTYRALAALLGDAMQPPIIPKDIDEPAAKRAKLQQVDDDVIFAAVAECRICMDTLAPEKFPQSRITSTCAHHPRVCRKCLTQHINTEVQTKASNQISCPECLEKVSDVEVKAYASPEVLQRNGRRTFIMSLQHLPNFTFCLGLTCESGQVHAEPGQPMMTCTLCGFKTCSIHQLPWHEDLTCAEFDHRNPAQVQQEAASEAWKAENTKLCPNAKCGMSIQKKVGCDDLSCKCDWCFCEFCWVCRADFAVIKREGNGSHKPECKWHTDNKNGMPRHGRRRAPARRKPAGVKESKKSAVGRTPKDLHIHREIDGSKEAVPEEMNDSKESNVPEDLERRHESQKLDESAKPVEASGLSQPDDVSKDVELKESMKSIESSEPAQSLNTAKVTLTGGSTRPNLLKRRRED
ncbi:hypothetical protein DSL72_007717 [Monilinia vaccinii-corymbosi]|uniref:RBR-type E3 ubiquitin transferase n=1 Tax=Monilinia vaccinii-corymbosi TaxID=61207 RepID=A0A8A3PHX3_9HELO|nr:hypothetical protein DSL72_007717 [Monilinia vaccinii-corymbosi]